MNPRTPRVALALLCPLAAFACKNEAAKPAVHAAAPFEIVFTADAKWLQDEAQKEMESALARHPNIDLVYGQNDPMAFGAYVAARNAGRTGIKFVGVDALAHEGLRYVKEGILDATIEYPTGGAEAVDLVLLAIAKITLPREIKLGTRVFTKQNLATGGDPIAAPGAKVIADLRTAHAKLLAPATTDQMWQVGLSQCNLGEPWRRQMNADIEAAIKKYPQLALVAKDAQNDVDKQGVQVEELIAQGVQALLISPQETGPLVAQCKKAIAKGIPVIVLDRALGGDAYTCFLGGDNVMISRAAGEVIKSLLPGATLAKPAKLVELRGLSTSAPSLDRHKGFAQALGIE